MNGIAAIAMCEFKVALRNRWVAIAVVIMALFAAVLSAAGSAPSGELGVDKLSLTVASLTSLAVYLVPLVALLMAFDAIAGEQERGTLPLLLTYPISRLEILLGKFTAHLGILGLAIAIGYGIAAALAASFDSEAAQGLPALIRLYLTSLLLGAGFLGLGYAISAVTARPGAAAGAAIAAWLILIVLYDLALLAGVVADDGGTFTQVVFPWLLLANPADAFRLYNLATANSGSLAPGLGSAAQSISPVFALAFVIGWSVIAFALATVAFERVKT